MTEYTEYSRSRDIAVKRAKRMGIDYHFPTVAELKQNPVGKQKAFDYLQDFLTNGPSLKKKREDEKPHYTHAEIKERKREYNRNYRRRRVAKSLEKPEHPGRYQAMLKGLQTLGIDIPPSKLPDFFAYMDARFAQGSSRDKKYVFDLFVDDFLKILKNGYSVEQILNDFEKFEADQALLAERAGDMSGKSYEKSAALWDAFFEAKKID